MTLSLASTVVYLCTLICFWWLPNSSLTTSDLSLKFKTIATNAYIYNATATKFFKRKNGKIRNSRKHRVFKTIISFYAIRMNSEHFCSPENVTGKSNWQSIVLLIVPLISNFTATQFSGRAVWKISLGAE